jgi:hypothetical protein
MHESGVQGPQGITQSGTSPNQQNHIMKTTRIVSLFAAAMSIILAATASAAPASKRIGPSKASASGHTTSTPVVHKAMKRVGPIGKGYVCNR